MGNLTGDISYRTVIAARLPRTSTATSYGISYDDTLYDEDTNLFDGQYIVTSKEKITVDGTEYTEYKYVMNENTVTSNEIYYLPIDYIESKSVKTTSNVLSQPMQSGDTMSDHMYREPVSITMAGSFSLNGRNWDNTTYSEIVNTTDRLTSIETVFEYIKNNGVLCTITTIASEINHSDKFSRTYEFNEEGGVTSTSTTSMDSSNTRFLTRENMALTDITWTENLNTLGFSFNFKEIISIDLIEYKVDETDLDLPSLESPNSKRLGELLAKSGNDTIKKIILKSLNDNGYIESEFAGNLAESVMWPTLAVVIVAVIAVTVKVVTAVATCAAATACLAAGGTCASIFPVGTVIAIAVAAVVAIGAGIYGMIKWSSERQRKKKMFKMVNGSVDVGAQRLLDLFKDVESDLNNFNSNITIYTIETETTKGPLKVIISIGGTYYYFTFYRNDENSDWNLKIENGDESDGEDYGCSFIVCTNTSELDSEHRIKKIDDYEVYIVNPSLDLDENKEEPEKSNVKHNLNSHSIWVSKGRAYDNIQSIEDEINKKICENGYNV